LRKENRVSQLQDYQSRYANIALKRHDGILEVTLHRDGGSALLSVGEGGLHAQLGDAFRQIAEDDDNRVVVLTGAGEVFLTEMDHSEARQKPTAQTWRRMEREGRAILENLLAIEVPIIGVLNGPAFIHAELVALSDIVLASPRASIADKAHMPAGIVPGDGVHVIWPMLLGPNRGRHFLLTGREISAQEALALGVVAEVVHDERLMSRAREIAADLASKPDLALRYARLALTRDLKQRLFAELGYGLALEGLGILGRSG
jgi:enoyl-CoA hydratase/carnithine racemase